MDIVIEKNIPTPKLQTKSRPYKEALEKMDIGDSFVAPVGKSQTIRDACKSNGRKVTIRTISKSEIRVWRIQ